LYLSFEKAISEIFELHDISKKKEFEDRNLKRATEKAEKFMGKLSNKNVLE
jgi:hypothetical protein